MPLPAFLAPAALRSLPWKWIGIGAVVLAVGVAAWVWIGGMRSTIAEQKAEIAEQAERIGTLRTQLDMAVETANHNADMARAADAERAAALARITEERREAARREGRLREALDEIDNWPREANDGIGSGLRGVLGRLRGEAGAGAPPADPR